MRERSTVTLPAPFAVAAEQFRSVGIAVRRETVLFGLALLLITVIVVLAWIRTVGDPNASAHIPLDPSLAIPIVLFGVLAPLAVWKDQGPSRRGYHWAMPVRRMKHDLTRVAMGWVWYMAALVLYFVWLVGISFVTGGIAHPNHAPQPLAWQWVVPFTAATVTYLFGTAVALSSDHPWRWFAGIGIGFLLVMLMVGAAGWMEGAQAVQNVVYGRWGLYSVINGAVIEPRQETLASGTVVEIHRSHPDPAAWLIATLLWLGLGAAATLVAARRYQEV